MKVLTVCGTRPDTIKMAPIINELKKYPQKVELIEVVTGQHKEMLEQVVQGTVQGMRGGQFDFSPRLLMFTAPFLTQNQTIGIIAVPSYFGVHKSKYLSLYPKSS